MRDNRWQGGRDDWSLPELPPQWLGQRGALLQRGTFRTEIGREVFLLLLEAPDAAPRLSWPAELRCKTGVADTNHGPIVFILWSVWERGERTAWYEQFLNPSRADTLALLGDLADQVALKTIMLDSDTGETLDVVEFGNTLVGDELLAGIRRLAGKTTTSFQRAVAEFTATRSIEELLDA